ncbi:MAG: hypothetical protein KME31_05895 [Tolypothrix carrinoi HA7290-LM1]|nr:hypothetical protein [Tolypothrix carrinoi HA7290-LM1]
MGNGQWAMGNLRRGKGEPLRWSGSALDGFPGRRAPAVGCADLKHVALKGKG